MDTTLLLTDINGKGGSLKNHRECNWTQSIPRLLPLIVSQLGFKIWESNFVSSSKESGFSLYFKWALYGIATP